MNKKFALVLMAAGSGMAFDRASALPGFFFRNVGVTDSEIRFIMEAPDLKATFQRDSVTYRTRGGDARVQFIGSNPKVQIESAAPITGKINFLIGDDASAWKTNVPAYSKIVYRSLYPGIDLSYSRVDGRLKGDFIVAPYADPAQIRVHYPDAERLRINDGGDLLVSGRHTELREQAPRLYQSGKSGLVEVDGRYLILDEQTVAFEVGKYDASRTLVIDPVVSFATFLGGSMIGSVTGVAADSAGNTYVTGWTESPDFPISGALQAVNRGGVDAFVAKLNPAGTSLVYATYIGGSGDDRAAGIAVDPSGQAYVVGSTASPNFPLVSPIRSGLGGGRDGFVVKLDALGSAFVYSTYLGGASWDQGTAIAVDAFGNAYIAGDTQSVDFPVANAAQSTLAGQVDAFVTKLTPSGAISFSTFLGGANSEHAGGIAIDAAGNSYIAGGTFSLNFPAVNAFQRSSGGGQDAFVTKVSANGSAFVYSTYLGGSGGGQTMLEQANAVAVDSAGNAYVGGGTGSANFPVTSGSLRTTANGLQDAFIAKLSPSGSLTYSTYFGGSASNWISGIAVDSSGDASVTGNTSSQDFPQIGGLQSFGGLSDAFVTEVNPSGSALVYSTLYGGSGGDSGNAIAVDSGGNVHVAGQTNSFDFPLHSAIQVSYSGVATGWIMCLRFNTPDLIFTSDTAGQAVHWSMGGAGGNTELSWAWISQTGVPGWRIRAVADFNADGYQDIFWVNDTTRQAVVWYMGGSGGNVEQSWEWINQTGLPGWSLVGAADFNGDGIPDLLWQNDTTRQVVIWYMNGAGTSGAHTWAWLSQNGVPGWSVKAIGDFNHDGTPDVVWQSDLARQAVVWYMSQGGTVETSWEWISQSGVPGWSFSGAGDFNHGGNLDVLLVNDLTHQVIVWYLGGPGTSGQHTWDWISQAGLPGWSPSVDR
jgi:hypothetical protein